jgi:flagellar export protein FliJ
MSDPHNALLAVVARLRHLAVDEAKRALADCLTAEAVAADAARQLDTLIAAETDAASDPSGDDRSVESFSVWLRRVGADRTAAANLLASAETRSAEARAVLAASRSAARAMDELLEGRGAERRLAADRREQAALDEAAHFGRA